MFVHGIYIWGASWEKTTGELIDAPPRHGCTALPVIHVTCWPASEKPAIQVNSAVKLANDNNDIIYRYLEDSCKLAIKCAARHVIISVYRLMQKNAPTFEVMLIEDFQPNSHDKSQLHTPSCFRSYLRI